MANRITGNEFNAVKNASYTVIAFEGEQRKMTAGNMSLVNAMQEVMMRGAWGQVTLVINEQQLAELGLKIGYSFNKADYADLFAVKWKVIQ